MRPANTFVITMKRGNKVALSDEDYGILLIAIKEDSKGSDIYDAFTVCKEWNKDWPRAVDAEHVKQLAMLIILSEGRELP